MQLVIHIIYVNFEILTSDFLWVNSDVTKAAATCAWWLDPVGQGMKTSAIASIDSLLASWLGSVIMYYLRY